MLVPLYGIICRNADAINVNNCFIQRYVNMYPIYNNFNINPIRIPLHMHIWSVLQTFYVFFKLIIPSLLPGFRTQTLIITILRRVQVITMWRNTWIFKMVLPFLKNSTSSFKYKGLSELYMYGVGKRSEHKDLCQHGLQIYMFKSNIIVQFSLHVLIVKNIYYIVRPC